MNERSSALVAAITPLFINENRLNSALLSKRWVKPAELGSTLFFKRSVDIMNERSSVLVAAITPYSPMKPHGAVPYTVIRIDTSARNLLVVIMVEFGWWALHSTRLSSEATLGGHGDPQETSECRSNSFNVFVTQGRNIYVLIVLRSTLGIEYSKMSPNISKISIPVLKPDH
jgi:hypothetical protein